MGRRLRASAFALAILVLAGPAWADPPANLATRVEEIRNQVGVPGMSVTIVENGQVTFARGW